jgi:predicted nucleotidyltransferase
MPPVPSPAVSAALARFRAALDARFGNRLREVVLFGSHARGDAHEESDVDVLVVIDDLTEAEHRDIVGMAYDAEDKQADGWVGLSPLVVSTARAAEQRARGRLLFRDIGREGVRA